MTKVIYMLFYFSVIKQKNHILSNTDKEVLVMKEEKWKLAGFLGTWISIISFTPQVYSVWVNLPKPATDVSLGMYAILGFSNTLWLMYGLKNGVRPIWLTNLFVLVFSLSIIIYKIIFG